MGVATLHGHNRGVAYQGRGQSAGGCEEGAGFAAGGVAWAVRADAAAARARPIPTWRRGAAAAAGPAGAAPLAGAAAAAGPRRKRSCRCT